MLEDNWMRKGKAQNVAKNQDFFFYSIVKEKKRNEVFCQNRSFSFKMLSFFIFLCYKKKKLLNTFITE